MSAVKTKPKPVSRATASKLRTQKAPVPKAPAQRASPARSSAPKPAAEYDVKDLALADAGRNRTEWAGRSMPEKALTLLPAAKSEVRPSR